VLEMRPNCECCDKDLPPDSDQAMICTFECTVCADCVRHRLGGACPNCGGGFQPRPLRPTHLLQKYPPSTRRIHNPDCAGSAT
jgi:uncharacterized protein